MEESHEEEEKGFVDDDDAGIGFFGVVLCSDERSLEGCAGGSTFHWGFPPFVAVLETCVVVSGCSSWEMEMW